VKDSAGKELICQAIDNDGDEIREFDAVIFQADFAANETKTFTLSVGPKQVFAKDQYKAFGRFVRERFDDFAWENDLIAHRTYGKALETWKGEPLTSSTIDIWSKRTPKMVINDWYLADDYHVDHGEGADYYSAARAGVVVAMEFGRMASCSPLRISSIQTCSRTDRSEFSLS